MNGALLTDSVFLELYHAIRSALEAKVAMDFEEIKALIKKEIEPHIPTLARCHSTPELLSQPLYRRLEPFIRKVLQTPETGSFATDATPARPSYRILAWNLERGIELDKQLEAFRTHEYLRTCDVLLLTETDVGMARSNNRAVAQTLADELGMHYAFAPCYMNLAKGSGVEFDARGENELGLHGNAVLSRYPLSRIRPIPLKNGKDKMAGREKRLGAQTALVADVEFPNYRLTVASVHLDAQSTQRHRRDQMGDVLEGLDTDHPVVIGGDWNTTTYNSSTAFNAIMGFWLRVFMGVDHVIQNHYLHPYHRFEKELFEMLEAEGFDYRQCNRLGEYTISYDVTDRKTRKNLGEWVPGWCFAFIRWALRNHGGKCPLKVDWYATRNVRSRDPVVIHDLREGRQTPLSDHDAIGVDIVVPGMF
jgi:endonuclease/exonuclease/phosphatase family metal-dependent hydrolase